MGKIKTVDDLHKLQEKLCSGESSETSTRDSDQSVLIKVAMATCSIASGSRDTLNYLTDELEKRNIDADIIKTGCMGYCYAEPTIEVTLPGNEPVVFGYVDKKQADSIIEKYIRNGELVEGIIPMNFRNIDYTTK